MRKELYTAIKTAMEKIEAVKHVDLWNHNVEFIEQEDSWARRNRLVRGRTRSRMGFDCQNSRGHGKRGG